MNISIVYMGDINAKNGASKIVKSFLLNKNIFLQNDINLKEMFVSRPYSVGSAYKQETSFGKVKSRLKSILSRTLVGNLISLYLQYFRNGKIAVDKLEISSAENDLLIFHDVFSCYIYYKKAKNLNKKSILVLHTNGDTWKMVYEYFPKLNTKILNKFLNKVEKIACDNADRIVFVSKLSESNFNRIRPQYKNKTTHIYNGIDDTQEDIDDLNFDNLNLVSVGTLNSRKAQNLIIEALSGIGNKSVRLTLVGDGEKRNEFYEIAKRYNVDDQVDFLGSRSDVEDILRKHNIFIMSSKDEGLPVSIIEAMKYGLPIIATNVGGIPELIDDNGILVEPTVESITDALNEINNNRVNLKRMSIKSREIFEEKFTVNNMLNKYSMLVKEVLYDEI